MTDGETAVKVEGTPAAEEAAAPTKLEVVKRPSQDKFAEDVAEIDSVLAGIDAKIQAVQKTISSKTAGLREHQRKVDVAKRRLASLRKRPAKLKADCAELQKKVAALAVGVDQKTRANNKIKDELKSMLDVRGGDINKECANQIRALERQQNTESMSLKDEKALVKRIASLKSIRKRAGALKVQSTRREEQELKQLRARIAHMTSDADRCDSQYGEREAEVEKMEGEMSSKRSKDLPALEKRRGELRKERAAQVKARRARGDQFYDDKRLFGKYSRELRKQQDEERRAEQAAWLKEKEEERRLWEEAEAKRKPWLKEIGVCDTILGFLRNIAPKEVAAVKVAAAKTSFTLADGTVVQAMGKNGADDAMPNFSTKKKKKKRSRKRHKQEQAMQAALRFSVDLLQLFAQMKLAVPKDPEDIDASIAAAQAKRDYWDTKPRAVKKKKAPKKAASKKKASPQKQAAAAATPPAAEASPEPEQEAAPVEEEAQVAVEEEVAVEAEAVVEPEVEAKAPRRRGSAVAAITAEAQHSTGRRRRGSAVAAIRAEVATPAAVEVEAEADTGASKAAEFNEYTCYDDDFALGKAAPSLASLDIVQGAASTYADKPTVVLFWAKFLKWQVYPAMTALEALHQSGAVNVVGIATDPKKSAVERHIEKKGCETTYALAFDAADGLSGGRVKNLFKEACGGRMLSPAVILVNKEGVIVWRQSFSGGNPYEKSGFEEQVQLFLKGEPLNKNGNAPVDSSGEEDEEEEGGGVAIDDPLAADVDW